MKTKTIKIPDPIPPLLLKKDEAARALQISPRKLTELTSSGEIPCKKIGASVRYRVSDLEAWRDKP